MAHNESKGWIQRGLEGAIRRGFMRAYKTVKVDPDKYLEHLRMAYDLPALTYDGVYSVSPEMLDHIAAQTIRASMRMAGASGAGFGMGGMFTIVPDLGILSAVTLRMLQKLSLIYGFSYNTEEEESELWIAAASAAGVDISRELLEKQFVSKFVPRVIQRIAVKASGEIVEKWTARLIPVDQLGNRRRAELLLREGLGRARHRTLSPKASASAAATGPRGIRQAQCSGIVASSYLLHTTAS